MNEGFATLYEYYAPHLVYPNERWPDSFITDVVQPVMVVDADPTIRPMTYYVENPDALTDLFDDIAYEKGQFVLSKFTASINFCFDTLSWKCS